jgi:hypothetical protein
VNALSIIQIGDRVEITMRNGMTGVIDAVLLEETGTQYHFVHWDEDGNRKSDWVAGFEIKKIAR